MAKAIDLTGMKFGRLTVIKRGENKNGAVTWICQCECGNITKPIRAYSLKSGNTTSCGCLRSNKMREQMKQKWENEEFRQKQSNATKQMWQDEEFRQKQSNGTKEQWKDEEFRQKQSNGTKEQWKDEEFRQMKSNKMKEQMKEMWQDEEMKWKMSYKGGITPISRHLRKFTKQWDKNVRLAYNKKCVLADVKCTTTNSVVHHLYGFNNIVQDAHNTYNIQIKEQVKDYTKEELKLLEEYITEWHEDTSNGVLLCKELHNLFHSLYGKGNNTPEQYEEFKQRYINGEFNI